MEGSKRHKCRQSQTLGKFLLYATYPFTSFIKCATIRTKNLKQYGRHDNDPLAYQHSIGMVIQCIYWQVKYGNRTPRPHALTAYFRTGKLSSFFFCFKVFSDVSCWKGQL